jgi:hypothetical protein
MLVTHFDEQQLLSVWCVVRLERFFHPFIYDSQSNEGGYLLKGAQMVYNNPHADDSC